MRHFPSSSFVSWTRIITLVLILGSVSQLAPAATFTVGGDGACGYSDLQVALLATILNGPGPDLIRVAKNQMYAGEYLIDNQSVSIVGGYDSCSDSTVSGRTVITRAFDERAFKISGTVNGVRTVELVNLDIRYDGAVSAVQDYGGTLHISDGHLVSLQNTNVDGGTAARGGGIWVDDSILLLLNGSSVVFNHATLEGGGIACTGSGATVSLTSATVANNNADYGGGLHVGGGCTLNDFAGGGLEGIFLNTADVNGGGIWAGSTGKVNLIGASAHPALVSDNDAQRGAGIFVTGAGTILDIDDSHVTANDATLLGGGIFAESGAQVTMDRTLGADCHDPEQCSLLASNTAAGSLGGAALHIAGGATAEIRQTQITGNRALDLLGPVIYVGGTGQLRLEGDVLAANRGNDVVLLDGSAFFRAAYISATGNDVPVGSSGAPAFYSNMTGTTTARIYSSIIYNATYGGAVYGGGVNGASHTWDCLIVHSSLGLEGGSFISVADPRFVNSGAGNYHLRPDSPAIDSCDTFNYTPVDNDIDDETRGWDDPSASNTLGFFDRGADEYRAPAGLIFSDGFESGNTSLWSSAVGG